MFKTKLNEDGSVEKRSAHVCPKGFTQVHGQGFLETYAPRRQDGATALRTCHSQPTTTSRSITVRHLDVECAFMHGEVEKGLQLPLHRVASQSRRGGRPARAVGGSIKSYSPGSTSPIREGRLNMKVLYQRLQVDVGSGSRTRAVTGVHVQTFRANAGLATLSVGIEETHK